MKEYTLLTIINFSVSGVCTYLTNYEDKVLYFGIMFLILTISDIHKKVVK